MESSRSSAKPESAPSAGAAVAVLDAVAASLRRLDADDSVVVAFSGGVDSAVLLDAVARFLPHERIVAWHVHHGLQSQADDWLVHCEREAKRIGVRFGATRLEKAPASGANLEGWARDERYRALWDAVGRTGSRALLTAHHADDQLETVLMRLARGSGPAALAGMAAAQQRAGGWLLAKVVAAMAFALVISALLALVGSTVGGVSLPASGWALLLVVNVLGVLPFAALGLLIGSLVGGNAAIAVVNVLFLPMVFLSGLWLPLSMLPDFFARLAPVWPAWHLGQIAFKVVGHDSGGALWLHVLALLVPAAVFTHFALRRLSTR